MVCKQQFVNLLVLCLMVCCFTVLVDKDECAEATACTMLGEKCINTLGNFSCICDSGYDKIGNFCEGKLH